MDAGITLSNMDAKTSPMNGSHINLEDFKMDSNFAWLLCSLVSTMAWVIYITYYNSRVIGYFITRLLNRLFIREGYMHVGSLTCNVLSGKIMFRDVIYISHDYTVRIQDGWLIFRWWRAYVPKDVSEDLSHSDTRLSVMLNGFELHVYNRCEMYGNLEKLFDLEPQMFPRDDDFSGNGSGGVESENDNAGMKSKVPSNSRRRPQTAALSQGHGWRDLIPVIKVDVASGRVVFGNRLVPTTLSINVEEAHFVYSTKPAASRLDHFMHFTKCKAENFKVILAPSPKYTGMVDDPPRYMGEGFVVLSSNNIDLYYYMDEAGLVPAEPEMLQLANGDIVESAPPIWGMDIKCGKGTDFSYGPWADRQRDHLFKFFFPNDCQPLKVTKAPQPGEKRSATSFDIRLSTLNEATVDILFSKNKETNAVHINVGPGSYLEVTMPWVVGQDGYSTKITGQLLHLEATTSLQYRSLVESETLEFTVKCHYPIKWNDHQEWILNLTGCKATVNLIYAHKWFFQDLVNDWASKSRPDLLHFVPYTWMITLLMKEFELITLCNEYNWVDCSSQNQENAHIAFCGDLFDLSFDLPFCDFLPSTIPLRFWIQGESVDLVLYLPEIGTSRSVLLALDANAKLLGRDGNLSQRNDGTRKWRNVCQRSNGWVDCWSVPIVALCINYIYHPMPPVGPPPQADITTPEKEEILLSPMRIPRCRKSPGIHWSQDGSQKFDPTTLPPDKVMLDLEIGPSVLLVYGAWLRNFVHLKENIFGEDQAFTDMHQSRAASNASVGDPAAGTGAPTGATDRGADVSTSTGPADETDLLKQKEFDPRQYRPFEVAVSITMHDIQAHLVKNCNEGDPPCPVILLERFGFEMKKGYRETQLQLLLSPAILLTSDKVTRPNKENHLTQGHLMLSGFQVRGHAMFSDEGRTLDEETLEYAWLLEVQLGKLSGKLTSPQLHHLVTSLETFVLLAKDAENNLRPPRLPKACHHGVPPLQCTESDPDTRYRCPSGDDIKYRMTRLAVDAVDLYLLENGTAFQIWVSPIRIATCNLHGHLVKSGVTGVLPAIQVRQFVATGSNFSGGNANHSNTNTTGSGRSQHNASRMEGSLIGELWLEVGSVSLGPLVVEAAMSLPSPEHNLHLVQHRYLRTHDEAHKRLWFLWSGEGTNTKAVGRCGCIGGCAFFGGNRNGAKFFKPSRQDFQDGVNMAAFRIHEPGRDPGFGQSILHEGQLVFHTPPYGSQDVFLQEPVNGWDSNVGNPRGAVTGGIKVAATNDRNLGESPGTLAGERSRSVAETNKDSSSRISTASPSPVSCYGDKRALGRRFSYTSASNRSGNNATRDVPYARLMDHSPTNLLPPKLDSDSMLNTERSKSILSVPEAEGAPKSSVSDSKLAVDYFNTASTKESYQQGATNVVLVPKPTISSEVNPSESHHSLSTDAAEENLRKEVQRTVSMSSENHSEAFYSADEDVSQHVGMSSSRTSSLRHSITLARQDSSGSNTTNRQDSFGSNATADDIFNSSNEDGNQHICMSTSGASSLSNCNVLIVEDINGHIVTTTTRKKFSSELSIMPGAVHTLPSTTVTTSAVTCSEGRSRLSSHRSDHEIHTPEHRNQQLARSPDMSVSGGEDDKRGVGVLNMATPHRRYGNKTSTQQRASSPRYVAYSNGDSVTGLQDVSEGHVGENQDGVLLDSSDTHSVSSTSFISAVSSQEDVALVNLHVQVNKPIIDSPLLMSSYVNHLSQASCNNWTQSSLPSGCDAFTVPLFQRTEEGRLIYIGGRYSPRFETLTEGFTSLRMITRTNDEHHGTPPPPSKTPTHPYAWDTSAFLGSESDDLETGSEEELLALENEYGTRTTVILKLKGDVDIMLSPLVLESLQRFIDAVTPTLASLHPLTVLNHLHAECISQVEAANILKRDQSLSYLSQFQASSKRSTAERNVSSPTGQGVLQANVYEESVSTQTQGTIMLPKVNITLLQASVVEEMISFSALDNIRDLTCVSLFAVCFDAVTARFHCSKQAREVVQTFHHPAVLPSGHKKASGSGKTGKPFLLGHQATTGTTDMPGGEPVYIETSEKQQEEMVFTLNISKIHAQLRRLRNESSILKDAVITAIPSHYSRVFFTCARVTSPMRGVDFYAPQQQQQSHSQPVDNGIHHCGNPHSSDDSSNAVEEKLGFIMFECGLEGVSLKVVKRSQFEKGENGNEEKAEQFEAEASHTDTVKSRDELEQQPTVNTPSGPSQMENNVGSSTATKAAKTTAESTGTGKVPADGIGEPGSGTATTTNNTAPPGTNTAGLISNQATKDGHGNTSSCVIELRTVWFNFAAPPRAPITRKIDFTRLDWNLLSTASPAINAWMNPSNRFAIRVVHMVRSMYRRSTGIVACLMAEALDVQGIHIPLKSRYGRYTPLAKTLQEDPSCQLCSVLQKYVLQSDLATIEANLRETDLPLLSTLRQGVIVLSRQWKNVLYTPLLLDHKYKSKHVKPLNVTFAVPEPDEENVLTDGEGEGSGEECEVTDECAMLLNTEAGAMHKVIKAHDKTGPSLKPDELLMPPVGSPHIASHVDHTPMVTPGIVVGGVDSLFNSPSPPSVQQQGHGGLVVGGHRKIKKSLPPSHPPSSSRASIVFPILGGIPFTAAASQKKFDAEQGIGYGPLREERSSMHHSHGQHQHLGSNPSIYSGGGPGSQHSVTSLENNFSPTGNSSAPASKYWDTSRKETGEDLYSWMAKQQDFLKDSEVSKTNLKGNWESKINTLTTEDTFEDPEYLQMIARGYSLYPMHDSLRLLDAHLIFEPLLSCLGVMPQQMISNLSGSAGPGTGNVSSFDTWGSNLSLVSAIETMRIDIVVSEFGKTSDKKKAKSSSASAGGNKGTKNHSGGKFYLDIPPETPAFLCEKMGVELDLKKMADMTVDDMIQKQNVLYISRGQLKKHTSTILNISLNVRYISQQVNMPLLRLLHQISNMYQNVKETQMELKEQHPEVKRENSTKNNKNGSSSTSDLHENVSVVDDKMKLPAGNGAGVGPGFPQSLSQQKILSPSASLRSRPQSFAQKLRSTSKSVKGYMNLSEGVTTPMFVVSPSGSGLEHITIVSDKSKDVLNLTPRCWKTVYYLLDLYATMPETKTITHRFSVAADISEGYKGNRKYDLLAEVKVNEDVEKGTATITETTTASTPQPHDKPRELSMMTGERTRLIVFGVARIHRTRLLATLSGLKLEAEITSLHSSLTCRKKSRPASLECSLTGHIGRTMIVLLEGVAPNQQTVVKVTVGKSQALYSSISRRSKDKNSGLLTVGAVNIDIPQHPVALHGMMTRGSKQLSSTLQELRVTRTSSRISRGTTAEEGDFISQHSPRHFHSTQVPQPGLHRQQQESSLLQPLVMQFSIILQSLSITAALLPSLQAQYKMDQVNSTGVTGSKAKFTIDLPQHSLSFTTKLQVHNVTDTHLPSEASIELPRVHVSAEYVQDGNNPREAQFADGVVFRQGSYLSAVADIGVFEHSLTTDLLNHLVFVQKVFMKEVNEVVQKVYGGEKPVPLWLEDSEEPSSSSLKRILFSLVIRIKRIQLTATTPTNSAVRLETGAVEFQLSNRVQNVSGAAQPNPYMKIFGKAQVDVNLSLGQLLKNVMFEEAEPEFQQYAFFKTRIGLRNAFQDEMVQGEDKEVVLITLKRPLIYIQPMAVDKAILVWLNYKNAYEYWNEQRSNLNKEVLTATQQVFEKVPFGQLTSQLSAPHLGTLFLQLTVDDMGICLPLNPLPLASWGVNRQMYDVESRGAVVVTLESTSISACSSGSLVSKGRFMGLCLRFADDFETSLDDWKPDMSDSTIMNLCVVSEGTYEVCSRTIAQKQGIENAKWFLNVQWQMEGVDIHLDVNVGKQLSALGHTLTMLTGSQEEDEPVTVDYDSDEVDQVDGNTASLVRSHKHHESISLRRSRNLTDSLPAFVFDPSLDAKKRSKLIEKEMNEQAKIINDLRSLGASHGTIEQEMKRLQELEAMVFKDFRRDMIQKLRRQSVKASSIKGKFGLGSKASTYRSRSFIVPSPTPEHHLEMESPDDVGGASINSNGNSASFESSPRSGPSRSASLRVRGLSGPRVTFSDTHNICRQSSLPSAGSDLSLPEGDLEWTGGDHIDIAGDKVELRRKPLAYTSANYDHVDSSVPLLDSCQKEQAGGTSPASYTAAFQKPQEPNIDFELDVKVFINSGKCVLHTKDPAKEDELKLTSRMKKERSCSGGMFDFPPSSPNMNRRSKEKPHGTSSTTRLRYLHSTVAQLVDLTIFHIPGLDVKVHYESRTLHEENVSPRLANELTAQQALSQARKGGTKKASLFAWMTLQSIPEETIISPHILEFLEQTLEPIPSALQQAKTSGPVNAMFAMDQDSSWAAATATSNYVYASFPVDVIVYFHMQPSTFRFSCLPVSRVECMLQLPSLDIVFSSKRAEEELHSEFGEGRPSSRPPSGVDSSTSRFDMGPSPSAVGGLSVTGCLADFSVYIFHPYGGGKKTGLKEAQWSPLADSERKDSLSVNVEFVKFHLSRSRKLNFQCDQQQSKGVKSSDQSQAVIRFSTIIDIGSASFKYDMRRLTEILAFPKAWYRRSIVRRLFLGDLSISATYSEGEESSPSSLEDEHLLAAPQSLGRSSMLDSSGRSVTDGHGLSRSAPTTERSPMLPTRDRLRLSLENDISRHARFRESGSGRLSSKPDTPSPSEQKSGSAWETLVLFAVNFTRLNVHMNMGNVMGNVTWLTKDFRSEGRLSIGSTGHKNMYIGVGLGGSSLDAKGGIVGGTIELSKIDTYIHIREDPGTEPDHTVGLKLFALELRLDYMGTGVLMCRVSSLAVSLRDEWKINRSKKTSENFIPTRRPAMIFMHGDLGWDQLQLMISKSTTADLLKMFYKLEEFFSQQFKSSKRVFSSLQPRTHPKNSSFKKKQPHAKKKSTGDASSHTWASSTVQDARHHRHWQRVLGQVGGLHLSTLSFPLPMSGTVLGGTMELHGNNISLACFHGINFKSKSWALFSLKEPCISFATEAQEIPSPELSSISDLLDVHVVQTLTFSLGMMAEHPHAQHHSMATVCRLSRNVLFPPQFRTLQEWFHYAFANSEIDAVDRFPSLERERLESSSEQQRSRSSSSSKLQDPNHTREVIFALPSLQLHLKTEHLQAAKTPDVVGQKPLVECSFITEFEDHIFVTVDAEAFFFLHDLITSYVKEKERVTGSVSGGLRAHSPDPERRGRDSSCMNTGVIGVSGTSTDEERKRKAFDPAEIFTKDWRNYHCKTWHLEPTVRLLSWAGKSIEPYGVDYILQKLGFSHARTTIPKWMQRGFMDPLDKVLAVLMLRMITVVREEPPASDGDSDRKRTDGK